jgi:hypothetical protein
MPAAVELVGDEVAVVDLLGLETIRIFEPDVHTALPLLADVLTAGSTLVIPDEHRRRLDRATSRANNADAVNAILGRLFPESRVPLPNRRVSRGARAERRDRRVSQAEVLRAYLYATLDDDQLASSRVERIVELFAEPAELHNELQAVDTERLTDLLDRLRDYELDYKPDNAVAVLLAFAELHPPDESDPAGALLAGRGPLEWQLQAILRAILDRAPSDHRALLAAQTFEASTTLSGKLLVLDSFGTRSEEEGVQQGVLDRPRTDELAAATLDRTSSDLATEERAARLLMLAIERNGRRREPIEDLLNDDGLMLVVLDQAMVYGSRIRLEDASGRLTARIRWQYLTLIAGEDFLRRRVLELGEAVEGTDLAPRTNEALSLATAVARGEAEPEPGSLGACRRPDERVACD